MRRMLVLAAVAALALAPSALAKTYRITNADERFEIAPDGSVHVTEKLTFASPIFTTSVDEFQRIVDLNLRPLFLAVRCAAPQLLRAGNGSVALAWNAPTGAVTYNVYRSTDPDDDDPTLMDHEALERGGRRDDAPAGGEGPLHAMQRVRRGRRSDAAMGRVAAEHLLGVGGRGSTSTCS